MTQEKIYLIIPVYNEATYLPSFFKNLNSKLRKTPQIKKMVFINDGSTDQTKTLIMKEQTRNKKIIFLNHANNKGRGEAMKTGLNFVKGKADSVIFMDGDNQHDPKFISQFITKLTKYPIVFGYRKLSKDSPWFRRLGNQVAGLIVEKIFKIKRKDLLCGYMAFRKDIFNKIFWNSKGYGVEAELTAHIGRSKIPFSEVLISTIYFDRKKGVNLSHAIRILLNFPEWYFSVKGSPN